ncbi:MAG: hypothetical protein R3E76_16320 [Planctomycetota bacterium]
MPVGRNQKLTSDGKHRMCGSVVVVLIWAALAAGCAGVHRHGPVRAVPYDYVVVKAILVTHMQPSVGYELQPGIDETAAKDALVEELSRPADEMQIMSEGEKEFYARNYLYRDRDIWGVILADMAGIEAQFYLPMTWEEREEWISELLSEVTKD